MQATKERPTGRLAAVLDLIPRGIEHPITVAKIAERAGISSRDVYTAIRVLLMQYDIPVGGIRSNGLHGVFIATNEREHAAALAPLTNNAKGIMRRVYKLRTIKLDSDTETKAQK